jgi:pimeloyl-ACP methyl ester carboxylesterase
MTPAFSPLRIEIGDGQHLAATVFFPAAIDDGTPRTVAFGFPGGGLSRGYWDVHHDSANSYSQAAFHVERGWVFVACDHLGVGESSQPEPETLTYARLAQANSVATRRIVDQLSDGSLVEGLDPIPVRATIGMGHSMGGCISIVAQGTHAPFDALAVLGFSAIQTSIPMPSGTLEVELKERDDPTSGLEESIDAAGGIDMFRWAFYWEDVEPALVEADIGSGYPRTGAPPPWGSPTTPPVVFTMLSPGVVADEAAAIRSPVLVASGERDVIPDLRAEAKAYRSSRDITLVEVPTMAHMHNFAGTRQHLWGRLHLWGESIAVAREER